MGLFKIARTVATKAGNHFGFYSKKQSVDVSINIGKELVDLSRAGKQVNKELVQAVVKKHVPNTKVNIISDRNEFRQLLQNAGENVEGIEAAAENYAAMYFNFGENAKGIFVPKLGTKHSISQFAHEFEHYMYNEHTPKRSLVLKIVQKITKQKELKNANSANTPKTYNQISLENKIQTSLHKYFGITDLGATGGLKGIEPTAEGVTEFLKGKNFTGLTSDKRVDAYIRTITRHHVNPKNTDSFGNLLLAKTTLDDEVRAYGVSDVVNRYASSKNDITRDGFVSEIYKRTSKILKGEMAKSLEILGNTNKTEVTKKVKTGLPKTSYVGENTSYVEKKFIGILKEIFGKPHKIKKINIGLFEQANIVNA